MYVLRLNETYIMCTYVAYVQKQHWHRTQTDRQWETDRQTDRQTDSNKVQGIIPHLFFFERGQFGKSKFTDCKVLFE